MIFLSKTTRTISFFVVCFLGVLMTSQSNAQVRVSNTSVFYYFKIDQGKPQPRVSLQKTERVSAASKAHGAAGNETYDPGSLLVNVTDASGRVVFETECENPLDQYIEYVNEKNELDRSHVQQTTGAFEARIPFDTAGKTVNVFLINAAGKPEPLASF